ncbi:1729_t:CDS:1, partial [Dentiscutata erythropus]
KQGPKAKELPCIFLDLVRNYSSRGLNVCGMPKSDHWRNANAPSAASKLEALKDLISELSDRQFSQFSLCVNHYNQVVVSDHFYQQLLGSSSNRSCLEDSSNNDSTSAFEFNKMIVED